MNRPPRLAVRGVILIDGRLLLVNAYGGTRSNLWCLPGGGVKAHASLPDNLIREVREETGLTVAVGAPCLINEFHDPKRDFHQIEVFFRCHVHDGTLSNTHSDPEGVVNRFRLTTRAGLERIRFKPEAIAAVAFDADCRTIYDPLEPIVA
ncbi:MAG: NUDIX hydrolase [Pseudomonadota bacterium]